VTEAAVRYTHAAEIAAGFDHPDGSARAAVRQALAEHPHLADAPASVIGAAARAILDGVPVEPRGPVECLACSSPAVDDGFCARHSGPARAGIERAERDRALAGL